MHVMDATCLIKNLLVKAVFLSYYLRLSQPDVS